jgi:hypothetical protein
MQEDGRNVNKIYQHLSLQDASKIPQNGIFGLKIYHLATLVMDVFSVDTIFYSQEYL